MSEVKVNKISPRTNCGTVQLGDSGDTITIPAGATITNNGTQTGFGRTGTVNWDTTAKTASFTAVSGNGYFVNTTSGAITVTAPASPSAGDIFGIKDYAGTFATNNVTVNRNGSLIDGTAANATLGTNQLSVFFVYVDGTQGWKATQSDAGDYGARFVTATGGTITTCGDFKIHTFTGPGTFCVSCAGTPTGSDTVDYLVVAGGAGGGGGAGPDGGAGGGAGGFRLSNSTCMPSPQTSPLATSTAIPVSAQGYPITVGSGGGGGGPNTTRGTSGNNSVFSTITSAGGGGGGAGSGACGGNTGADGGSGGGGHQAAVGSGNTPPVSPPQGNPGGGNTPSPSGGAGGGASAAGSDAGPADGGAAGAGSFVVSSGFAGCNGTTGPVSGARYFAGGGGGSNSPARSPSGNKGAGGTGGGGDGGGCGQANGRNGTANTGGAGGGGASGSTPNGGGGGSGIVIIRYKFQ